nr:hypothetical protein BgiMline_028639 [Biomphalaria glabrata]
MLLSCATTSTVLFGVTWPFSGLNIIFRSQLLHHTSSFRAVLERSLIASSIVKKKTLSNLGHCNANFCKITENSFSHLHDSVVVKKIFYVAKFQFKSNSSS